MDALTEVFTDMQIRRASFTRLEATAPWAWASAGERLVKFVLVVRGAGVVTTPSQPEPIPLRGGDVFIMLDDEPYRMYDHEDSLPMPCVEVERLRIGNRIEVGGGGARTTFVSGFFEIDEIGLQPLAAVLPKLLHLKLEQNRSLAFQSVLELLAAETERPGLGSEAVVSRLFELLFVHAIRAYCLNPDGPSQGWLAALADRHLARVMAAIHNDPSEPWTVQSLAEIAGLSRSAFANRFRSIVGKTPLDYVTALRVHRARRRIHRSGVSLAEAAHDAGYESVAAFHRAFKRETGQTPGAYRKTLASQDN
jgi:AraC-like DNA-binding protein